MAQVTVEIDDDQIYEIVDELDKRERIELARSIIENDDEDFEDDLLEELGDDQVLKLVKERCQGWTKAPISSSDRDTVRALFEFAMDAAKAVGLITGQVEHRDGTPITVAQLISMLETHSQDRYIGVCDRSSWDASERIMTDPETHPDAALAMAFARSSGFRERVTNDLVGVRSIDDGDFGTLLVISGRSE